MKPKTKPVSKIPTTKTNTNKKKGASMPQEEKLDTSLIKKNEFALILFGALLLTVIVFFLFFRSSSSKTIEVNANNTSASYAQLEKRIQELETSLKTKNENLKSENGDNVKNPGNIDLLAQRVARLEAAFSVKFDSIIDRLAGMENNIAKLKKIQETKTAVKPVVSKTVVKKPPVKKASSSATKKTVQKTDIFHTVLKGETLYSISKKYNTTVQALRKLNNLTSTAKIYPGNNILVR